MIERCERAAPIQNRFQNLITLAPKAIIRLSDIGCVPQDVGMSGGVHSSRSG